MGCVDNNISGGIQGNLFTTAQSEKISLDPPTDIVVDTAYSEKVSLDSPTDIVVDTAQSEQISLDPLTDIVCKINIFI
jgi:hypothetical protein